MSEAQPNLAMQYSNSITGLDALGHTFKDDMPSLWQVESLFTPAVRSFLEDRVLTGATDRLVIAPTIAMDGLITGRFNWMHPGLVNRFNAKQESYNKARINRLWEVLSDAEHDNGYVGRWMTGVILGDRDIPDANSQARGIEPVPGLVFKNQTAEEQRALLIDEAQRAADRKVVLSPLPIGPYIAVCAINRALGVKPPDVAGKSSTRLVHYNDRQHEATTVVPAVHSTQLGGLVLTWSDARLQQPTVGVRRFLDLQSREYGNLSWLGQ